MIHLLILITSYDFYFLLKTLTSFSVPLKIFQFISMQTYPLSNKVFVVLDNFNNEVIAIQSKFYKPGSKFVIPLMRWYNDITDTILSLKNSLITKDTNQLLQHFSILINYFANISYIKDPLVNKSFITFCTDLVPLIYWKALKCYLYTILDYWNHYEAILPINFFYFNEKSHFVPINGKHIKFGNM